MSPLSAKIINGRSDEKQVRNKLLARKPLYSIENEATKVNVKSNKSKGRMIWSHGRNGSISATGGNNSNGPPQIEQQNFEDLPVVDV